MTILSGVLSGGEPSWKKKAAAGAQEVYDDWTQNEEGWDEMYGGGGICDNVALALVDALNEAGIPAFSHHYEDENHTVAIAQMGEYTVVVDIPFGCYETGSWYRYKKIPDVTFTPDMVTITRIGPKSLYDELLSYEG